MASLFRNSRSIVNQFASIRRTATTVVANNAGTQVKTGTIPQVSRPTDTSPLAVRDAQRRSAPIDPIKPRPASDSMVPLVGKALNVWGNIGFTIVLAISAYFFYINYITNPEFYKSLAISREASKRDKDEHAADFHQTSGHKGHDSGAHKAASDNKK